MAATLKDLAHYTGYSVGTISNYINGAKPVSKEKQVKIDEAIEALHYTVNFAARMLKTNEFKTIGILIPDFKNVFCVNVVSCMEEKLNDSGYNMIVLSYNADPYKERKQLQYLAQRTDGILYTPTLEGQEHSIADIQQDTPIVTFNGVNEHIHCDKVMCNNADVVEQAVNALFQRGHQSIAMMTGPQYSYTGQQRRAGYYKAFEKRGLAVDESMVCAGDYSKASGAFLCKQLIEAHPEMTAMMVAGYLMTLGVITYLKENDLSDKIAVIGYDAKEVADSVSSNIGYVYQSYQKIAEQAVALVLRRVNHDMTDFPQMVKIAAELCDIGKLPMLNEESALMANVTKIPHLLGRNRVESVFSGGRLLDEWQRLGRATDNMHSEEILFSTLGLNHRGHVSQNASSMALLPDGREMYLRDLIKLDPDGFLGQGYHSDCFSVHVGDITSQQLIQCHINTPFAQHTPSQTPAKERMSVFYIVKTRYINGIAPCLYVGFKQGVTQEQWRALMFAQDHEGMLACMHAVPLHEGDIYLIKSGVAHCFVGGSMFVCIQTGEGETFAVEERVKDIARLDGQAKEKITQMQRLVDAFSYETCTMDTWLDQYKLIPFATLKMSTITSERVVRYEHCDQFRVERYTFTQAVTLPNFTGYRVVVVLKGCCELSTEYFTTEIAQGRSAFIPNGVEELELAPLEGQTVVFVCYPSNP